MTSQGSHNHVRVCGDQVVMRVSDEKNAQHVPICDAPATGHLLATWLKDENYISFSRRLHLLSVPGDYTRKGTRTNNSD